MTPPTVNMSPVFILTMIIFSLLVLSQEIFRISVIILNRHTPVAILSPDMLHPLTAIISFPTGVTGMCVRVCESWVHYQKCFSTSTSYKKFICIHEVKHFQKHSSTITKAHLFVVNIKFCNRLVMLVTTSILMLLTASPHMCMCLTLRSCT